MILAMMMVTVKVGVASAAAIAAAAVAAAASMLAAILILLVIFLPSNFDSLSLETHLFLKLKKDEKIHCSETFDSRAL